MRCTERGNGIDRSLTYVQGENFNVRLGKTNRAWERRRPSQLLQASVFRGPVAHQAESTRYGPHESTGTRTLLRGQGERQRQHRACHDQVRVREYGLHHVE